MRMRIAVLVQGLHEKSYSAKCDCACYLHTLPPHTQRADTTTPSRHLEVPITPVERLYDISGGDANLPLA
jgi:hypothetical protein